MKAQRWQDWILLILGIWLFFSPFWLPGYMAATSVAAWNAYIFGVLVFAFAWAALTSPHRWEEWLQLAFGIWLLISPYVLGFSTHEAGAARNAVIVGILVGLDAIWGVSTLPSREVHA